MATITLNPGATKHPSRWANVSTPYLIEVELDFADALAAKGSALADADVIKLIDIPANTVVLHVGAAVKTAANATTATIDVGTGADPDEWVNDLDVVGGTYGADLSASPVHNTYAAADTIDAVLASVTGTLSTGKVRIYALMLDVSDKVSAGIAALGS